MADSARRDSLERRRARLDQEAPALADTVRGSLVERYLTCGKPSCRCHSKGPRHGPYHYLLTTVGTGKTRTTLVPKQQLAQVRRWVRNFRQLKKRLEKISEINTELIRVSRSEQKSSRARRKPR